MGVKVLLLVEDDRITAQAEKAALELYGYRVIHVSTGIDALEQAVNPSFRVDLILMDINLGSKMDGISTAQAILTARDVPIIFLTAYEDQELLERIESLGCYGYLLKTAGKAVLDVYIKLAYRLHEERFRTKQMEERYRTIVESAPMAIFIQLDHCFVYLNPEALRLFGVADQAALIGIPVIDRFHTEHRALVEDRGRKVCVERTSVREPLVTQILRNDNMEAWVESFGEPVVYDGKKGALIFMREITQQRKAEGQIKALLREKELILKEVHHRLKNNMNLVNSFLILQSASQNDGAANEVLEEAARRVRSMGLLYDKLYLTEYSGFISIREYLSPLLEEILSIFPNKDSIGLKLELQDLRIEAKHMYPLVIILNELISNCMKHAFTESCRGIIQVRFSLDRSFYVLKFRDNGRGRSVDPGEKNESSGFGLELVEMLVQQLHGTMKMQISKGTCYLIRFPR